MPSNAMSIQLKQEGAMNNIDVPFGKIRSSCLYLVTPHLD